jgi:beta-lactamase class A
MDKRPEPVLLIVALLVFSFCRPSPFAAERATDVLSDRLAELARAAPGTLGVRVLHVESGAGAAVNGGEWFPMMSVYKLPIAIHVLRRAERGGLDLERPLTLTTADRRPGTSPLARTIEEKGAQTLSIRSLLSAILRVSDNTAR